MGERYSDRLVRLQTAPWKRLLDVQRPYRMHLRALEPGLVLDVGCGIGRNLEHLRGHGVGIDLDPESVEYVRRVHGYRAYTPDEFLHSSDACEGRFDTLLFSHVLEHLDAAGAEELVRSYLRFLARDGRVFVFVPQEVGYANDPTHERFFDEAACASLASALGLRIQRSYSFPFPRPAGRWFRYNEFVFVLRRDR